MSTELLVVCVLVAVVALVILDDVRGGGSL